jgi:hypothetical protein
MLGLTKLLTRIQNVEKIAYVEVDFSLSYGNGNIKLLNSYGKLSNIKTFHRKHSLVLEQPNKCCEDNFTNPLCNLLALL